LVTGPDIGGSTSDLDDRPPRAFCEDWRVIRRNSLRGFAKVRFPSGLIISEIAVHAAGDGRFWASPPARQMVGSDGHVLRDSNGKPRWQPVIEFVDKGRRDAWSASVIQSVADAYPTALQSDLPAGGRVA
jgi:hypothetical protein